jgi:hypothetical protein
VNGDDMPIREALAIYYRASALPPDGGASSSWFFVRVGPLRIPLPNPPVRKRAALFHDIHHTLTGYDTVFARGEMIIAGHEIAVGCGRIWLAWIINLWMFALGLLWVPRRMFAAFVRGRHSGSLYVIGLEGVMEATVGELRHRLGLDRATPPATRTDRWLFAGWAVAAWGVTLATAGVVGVVVRAAYALTRALV